eukprot:NODE_3603_length_937_cov_26.576543_g3451_i0.p1 GENE.NODE_3603_length_937_cov_26.576543_g3451_i0~~NODE_3603_length_937_cov_26.576543_g3451_i0.p1  ORF type:complete len:300 (-),score=100.78 NODE_3603_length_937_cov_26.576543_g3451_i0:38-862(-)
MEFDLVGTCAPIANTLRRVMLEDVPTIAIELVDFHTNTTVLQDENLASRLGLTPIRANPKLLKFPASEDWKDDPLECLKFVIDVTATQNMEPVLSSALKWEPLGNQEKLFAEPPRPVLPDIMIAKLKPGQRIHAEMYACKGTGATHAKFSPACPVSYRMHPKVVIQSQDPSEAAALAAVCPGKVFDIEDGALVVRRPRDCTMCRECIRIEPKTDIRLSRLKDHFIFSVESTGVYTAPAIVQEALRMFEYHCKDLKQHVSQAGVAEECNEMDVDT